MGPMESLLCRKRLSSRIWRRSCSGTPCERGKARTSKMAERLRCKMVPLVACRPILRAKWKHVLEGVLHLERWWQLIHGRGREWPGGRHKRRRTRKNGIWHVGAAVPYTPVGSWPALGYCYKNTHSCSWPLTRVWHRDVGYRFCLALWAKGPECGSAGRSREERVWGSLAAARLARHAGARCSVIKAENGRAR
ncbi:hypothetical protein BOTBODRAFT_448102 [Botryobasidium botryosum FD-172 SS1]|uniref:Uncharacterized protein n=1 Tax=Botryobasidium botryosum (strain FD-172 SS1) TaxID=930990 RepID=A0A067MB00_BOTB1|nr:hypothetical protein BOTBODRAFT_448102 [Botryobasidium botryosum FD-172 SS1]